jgi:hypothetical protein
MTVPNKNHISLHSLHYFLHSKLGLNLESKDHYQITLGKFWQLQATQEAWSCCPPEATLKMTYVSHEDILAGKICK